MRIIVTVLLLLGAQFSFTAFAPAGAGKAWLLWPFSADSKPWLGFLGGLPRHSGSSVTPVLAGLAGLGFLAAVLSLLGWFLPANWFVPLVLGAASASGLLFVLYFRIWSIPPIIVDIILLWGVVSQNWSLPALQGG